MRQVHDPAGSRTRDLRIKSPLLYQLSYRVVRATGRAPPDTSRCLGEGRKLVERRSRLYLARPLGHQHAAAGQASVARHVQGVPETTFPSLVSEMPLVGLRRSAATHQPRADIAFCYGTRPQVIKAARITPALRARWDVATVDTGQHFDYALNEGLYRDLGIDPPTEFLGVGAAHPVEQTARIAAACSRVLAARQPVLVVVIGDTNSTLGCAVAAADLGIPLVHVEAGLRSGVLEMAEERNRVAVDAMSQLLCAPCVSAVHNLTRESLPGVIVQTGDVARDVLLSALGSRPHHVLAWIPDGPFALATLHRAELTDHRERLAAALDGLGDLGLPVILPMHPRTASRISQFGLGGGIAPSVRIVPPLGYRDSIAAIARATVVVTDSGGVQREAYWLGTPCVTLRGETEWTETVTAGANRLVPPEQARNRLAAAVRAAAAAPVDWNRDAYGAGSAAAAIVDAIDSVLTPAPPRARPRR